MGAFGDRFTSNRQDWQTPDSVFKPLDDEFKFTLDVCATPQNARCENYFTTRENGLLQEWSGCCWMNPPFGDQAKWVKKAYRESRRGVTVVCLLPTRTNTEWWHNYCMKGEVRFIRGRPKFGNAKYGTPQPLAIVIFHGKKVKRPSLHRLMQCARRGTLIGA